MRFVSFVFKNVTRRRIRSLLTVIGVAVAVGAVVALVGISNGFEKSFLELYEGRGVDLVVVRAGSAERLTSALDDTLDARIQQIEGVRDVTPILMDVVSLSDLDVIGIPITGWRPDAFMFDDLQIREGRRLGPEDRRGVMLGQLMADQLEKRTGDTLEIVEGEPFEVVGVFESFSLYENGSMIVLLDALQELMDRRGQATGFNVRVERADDAAEVERIAQEVEGLLEGLAAMQTKDFVASDMRIRVARAMAWLTSVIALLIGGVGVLNTMIMSVYERTQEIGILRAIGWRKTRVMRMILLESLLLSLFGAIAGTVGAILLTRGLSQMPAASGFVAGDIAPHVVFYGFALALGVGLVGGLYPAVRGAQMLPTEALRHE